MFNDATTKEPGLPGFSPFLPGLASDFFAPANSAAQTGQGFDQFMSDLETGRSRGAEAVGDSRNNRNNRNNHETNHETRVSDRSSSRRTGRTEARDDRSRGTEQETGQVGIAQNPAVLDSQKETPTDNTNGQKEAQDVIVDNLAEATQIPAEMVYEILADLDIQPEELSEAPKANKLLQNLLQVENPAELLTVSGYPDALKEVVEAVAEILETAAPAEAKPNLDRLAGLVAEVDQENRLIISQETEKTLAVEVPEDDLSQMMEKGSQGSGKDRNEGLTNFQGAQAGSYEEIGTIVTEQPEIMLQDSQLANTSQQAIPVGTMAAQQAAAVHAAVEATSTGRVDPTQVMEQIVSKVKTVSAENFAELRITLRPEHLGDVSLRVTVQSGVVMAMFVAESQRVKEIIEANFNMLREALAEQGIEVGELFVSVSGEDAENQMSQMNQMLKAQQEAMRRLQRAAGLVSALEEEEEEPVDVDPTTVYNNTVEFTA